MEGHFFQSLEEVKRPCLMGIALVDHMPNKF